MTPTTPIARRTFTIGREGRRTLELVVHPPVEDGADYRCDYAIVENGRSIKSFHGMGVDSMQALISALQRLGSDIASSDEAMRRDLYWNGQNERLGLLLPPGCEG
jgi:hypothetical protein